MPLLRRSRTMRRGQVRLTPVKDIAGVIAAPFPVSPRKARKADFDARARRGASAPARFERQVIRYLRKHGHRHGIVDVKELRNVLVDGTVVLKTGRRLIIEIKYRMGWATACVADCQVDAFLRLPTGRRRRASGALVIFEEFNGDWARRRKGSKTENGWFHWYTGHCTAAGPFQLPARSCAIATRPTRESRRRLARVYGRNSPSYPTLGAALRRLN